MPSERTNAISLPLQILAAFTGTVIAYHLLRLGLALWLGLGSVTAHHQARCFNNLKMIGLALTMYADDNEGVFPPDLCALVPLCITYDPWTFKCRATSTQTPARFAGRETFVSDYWYRGACRRPGEGESPIAMAMDYVGNHPRGWGAVVFSDWHTEWHKGKDWYRAVGDGTPPTRESGPGHTPGAGAR